ncbi:iron-sulfur cluster assembly protein [Pedobacter metabolipauper]|uniref:Iron-sulfur cluster assembly protein n=2 Tax=Pedobacter metabolipauper TaxID=425513 RepID=A0A4R6T0N8_9SPHI|nr:iron-sulfur cluster assembly protein [Pedobacter metabolipauper]
MYILFIFTPLIDFFQQEVISRYNLYNLTIMSTTVDTAFAPVTFTEGAVKELFKLKDQQEISEDFGLRVGVDGGGCSGMSYVLGFDQKKEGDQEFIIDGIKVFMHKAHQMYLLGMQVDWQDGLNSRGFTFSNPNANSTCGCGTSFSV